MNRIAIVMGLVAVAAATVVGQSRAVTHIDSDKVATALAKGGSLVASKDFTVAGSHRMGPGMVEVHDHETDIFYVTDGEATVVTGGTTVGGKQPAPGQQRGPDLTGGPTQKHR